MKSIMRYFRDDIELSKEQWFEQLNADSYFEQESCQWSVEQRITDDFTYDNKAWVNEHFYKIVEETHYDTAKELINDMIDYDDCELLEAIQQFSESECQMLLKYIPRARIEAEYFVLSEGNIDG